MLPCTWVASAPRWEPRRSHRSRYPGGRLDAGILLFDFLARRRWLNASSARATRANHPGIFCLSPVCLGRLGVYCLKPFSLTMQSLHPLKGLLQVQLASDASAVLHLPYVLETLSAEHLQQSPHTQKWCTRVNSLLHSRDLGARWSGLCLALQTSVHSKSLMMEYAASWIGVALPLLSVRVSHSVICNPSYYGTISRKTNQYPM